MNLSISDIIQIIGIIASFTMSLVAIIISIITVRQNSKMIEESTRASISVYGASINPGDPMFYLVVRNFGSSPATLTKFKPDFDFSNCYRFPTDNNYIEELNNCTIAPGQSRICLLDYQKIDAPITFELEYLSSSKKYCETQTVNLKSGAAMVISKNATQGKELRTISYTLQEMLQQNL